MTNDSESWHQIEPRRRPDGSLLKPEAREPSCVHSTHVDFLTQPASACRYCKGGEPLRRWKAEWAAWLAEHPSSPEAKWVRRLNASDPYEGIAPHDVPGYLS